MNCKATTKAGIPCTAASHHDSDYCWLHDPAIAEQRNEARARGGAVRRDQLRGRDVPQLVDAADVRSYLNRTLGDTAAGLVSPAAARAIAHLCKVQLEAVREVELMEQMGRRG